MDSEIQGLKRGMIIMWAGIADDIPAGWAPCNGLLGTPDLRDRFTVNKGPSYSEFETGGGINHSHYVDDAEHTHTIPSGTGIAAGTDFNPATDQGLPNIMTEIADGRPSYYCLHYIMKL